MKFLLVAINAKFIHSNPAVYSLRAYAGSELQKFVEIAEYTINQAMEEILGDIYQRHPDIIGFSCYIWNWRMIQELLEELPKVLPGVPLWLGGPEVSYQPEQALSKLPVVTGIMTGEGEATFRELLGRYVEYNSKISMDCREGEDHKEEYDNWMKSALAEIAGLCLPQGHTASRKAVSLTELPFLYRDMGAFANRILYYESSRGCPYRCSYCLSSVDRTVRLRDMNVVKEELQFFLDHRVSQVKFVDRTFNCNHHHSMEIWKYILEHDNGVTNFHFEIAADILKEDQLALLRRMRPGLVQLEIGVQSVNGKTIRAIDRVMDVDRLEAVTAFIREGGNIHQHLDLIAGLPYEDLESFARSFDRVYSMKPQQLQLGFLKVLKGSPMYDRAEEYGISYRSEPPYEVLYTRWLSYDDVLRLKRIEQMVELYYNSSQFVHTLEALAEAFASPFAMFDALAAFYEGRGFVINSPSRVLRYEALLEFAVEYDGRNAARYRELLTFDLYLRENMKSRPAFSADLSPYRETIRDFYRKEAEDRLLLPGYKGFDARQLMKMTHLEPFTDPVWDLERRKKQTGAVEAEARYFILFDYRERNPLNFEARTIILDGSGRRLDLIPQNEMER